MSNTTDTPKASGRGALAITAGVLIAMGGGLILGLALSGVFPQWYQPTEALSDLQLDTSRPLAQAPQETAIGATDPQDDIIVAAPVSTADPAPDPIADEALRALLARRAAEEARLTERRRLASESPLTPAASNLIDLIRSKAQQNPPPSGAAPGAIPGTETSMVPAPAPVLQIPPAAGGATLLDRAANTAANTPADTHVLARGAIIPAVLESAIDSELSGLVRARVSEHVYDTVTGAHVLIPRGAALIGVYTEATKAGAQRLFVSWTDLRLPDGTPMDMQRFSSLGADGAAGLRGRRSTGLLKALGAAVLFDLAGNATRILTGEDQKQQEEGDLAALVAAATGNATSRVADQYLGQLLSRGTRFRVAAGAIINIIVEEDMALPAVAGQP